MSYLTAMVEELGQPLIRSPTLTHAPICRLGVTASAGIYVPVAVSGGQGGRNAPLAFIGAAILMSFSAATLALG